MTGVTLPANLNVYVSAVLFVLGAYLFALYLGLVVWTFRDIRARSRDVLAQIMAALLVAIFTIPGWLVYLLLRPHNTLAEEYDRDLAEEAMLQDLEERHVCPGCRRRVEADFLLCPSCHRELRVRCTSCGRLLNLNWDVCPYCGLARPKAKGRGGKDKEKAPEVAEAQAPAAPSAGPAPVQETAQGDAGAAGAEEPGETPESTQSPEEPPAADEATPTP